jgi:hypothetical protein
VINRFFAAAGTILLCMIVGSGCSSSSNNTGMRFDSPQAAVDSLVDALRANDTQRLKTIFGPKGDQIVSSGDPVQDQYQVGRFLEGYDKGHRLETEPDGNVTLLVGEKDWPFPVPIIKVDRGYAFDAAAGEEEILNRRIGRNELATEQVCLAVVDAQHDYAQMRPMGGELREYAPKLVSDPGKKNGLYWPTQEGEPPSPLGPLAATAAQEGYGARNSSSGPQPYHGYYYRLLTSQGPNAPGGATDYMVNGHLIGGFGVIAYPAQYGNSGITTFMTNHDGVLYERDLGPDTAKLAQSITSFDPGPEWKVDADAAAPPGATTRPAADDD